MDNYIVKKGMDSFGNDYGYYPNKSIPELCELADSIEECVGFNSKGYLKTYITTDSKLRKNENIDLYINHNKIQNIIDKNKNIASGNIKKDITFVITTCKRLDFFIDTINRFLYHCRDVHVINRWLCIDDNSSEEDRIAMKKEFPFFNFILKTEDNKGHAKSLNMMLDSVKTKYVLLFEDDWACSQNFYIEPYIQLLNQGKVHQILFHTIFNIEETFKFIKTINNTDIHEYVYSSICQYKYRLQGPYLEKKLAIEKLFNIKSEVKGFHNPGFSLNPSIFNLNQIKKYNIKFKESKEDNDIFELYFAFECLKNNFKVSFTKIGINHTGWGRSSYILNGLQRCYELPGTPYVPSS